MICVDNMSSQTQTQQPQLNVQSVQSVQSDEYVVFHLADIHIHAANGPQLAKAIEKAAELMSNDFLPKTQRLCIIAGDVFEYKNTYSAADVSMFYNMIDMFSRECAKVIVVPGNHDVNIQNLDNQEPLIRPIRGCACNYLYLEDGSHQIDENVVCHVVKQGIDVPIIPPISLANCNKINILIIHEDIAGQMPKSNQMVKISSTTLLPESTPISAATYKMPARINRSKFSNYTAVMAGHIHDYTMLEPNAAYCGSLVQKTIGESFDKGMIRWSFKRQIQQVANSSVSWVTTHKFTQIDDPIAAIKFQLNGEILTANCLNPLSQFPTKPARIHLEYQNVNSQDQHLIDLQTAISNKFDCAVMLIDKSTTVHMIREKCTNPEDQNLLVRDALCESKEHAEYRDEVLKLHKKRPLNFGHNQGSKWSLLRLSWSNALCYGPENFIDFSSFGGSNPSQIIGLIADNRRGKSAILEILIYAMYGKRLKGKALPNFPNWHMDPADTVKVSLDFEVDDIKYTIKRMRKLNKDSSRGVYYFKEGKSFTDGQKFTENLFGDMTLCLSTIMATQTRQQDLIDLPSAKTYELFSKLLELEVLRKRESELTTEINSEENKLRNLTSKSAQEIAIESTTVDKNINSGKARIAELDAKIQQCDIALPAAHLKQLQEEKAKSQRQLNFCNSALASLPQPLLPHNHGKTSTDIENNLLEIQRPTAEEISLACEPLQPLDAADATDATDAANAAKVANVADAESTLPIEEMATILANSMQNLSQIQISMPDMQNRLSKLHKARKYLESETTSESLQMQLSEVIDNLQKFSTGMLQTTQKQNIINNTLIDLKQRKLQLEKLKSVMRDHFNLQSTLENQQKQLAGFKSLIPANLDSLENQVQLARVKTILNNTCKFNINCQSCNVNRQILLDNNIADLQQRIKEAKFNQAKVAELSTSQIPMTEHKLSECAKMITSLLSDLNLNRDLNITQHTHITQDLAQAAQAAQAFDECKNNISSAEAKLASTRAELQQIEKELKNKNELKTKLTESIARCKQQEILLENLNLEQVKEAIHKIKKTINSTSELEQKIHSLKVHLAHHKVTIYKTMQQENAIISASIKRDKLEIEIDEINSRMTELEQKSTAEFAKETIWQRAQKERQMCILERDKLLELRGGYIQMAERLAKEQTQIVVRDEILRNIAILKAYRFCFSKNGISKLIIKKATSRIEEHANTFLHRMVGDELRIKIATSIRENESRSHSDISKPDDTHLDITVEQRDTTSTAHATTATTTAIATATATATTTATANNRRIHHHAVAIDDCSGFQKFVVSLAMRIAFTKVGQCPIGNFLIIDEGFGCLDATNLDRVRRVLPDLQNEYNFIMVISHLGPLRGVFGAEISINRIEHRGVMMSKCQFELQSRNIDSIASPSANIEHSANAVSDVVSDVSVNASANVNVEAPMFADMIKNGKLYKRCRCGAEVMASSTSGHLKSAKHAANLK